MAVNFSISPSAERELFPGFFFLVLGSYDVKRSWNSTFDFYTFPPSVCSVQLQSYTFSAPSYFCSFTVYVWGQIISEVEILYIKALQIHVRLKTFEIESLFLWAFVLALVRRMTAAAEQESIVHKGLIPWTKTQRTSTKAKRKRSTLYLEGLYVRS